MELNGILFRTFNGHENIVNLSISLLEPIYEKIWINAISTTKNETEVLYSVCFYDDIIKYSSQVVLNNVHRKFIDFSTKFQTSNQDILQSVVWGFGELARRLDSTTFEAVREVILSTIFFLIQRTDAFSSTNGECTDNAIGAYTKFVIYQCKDDNTGLEAGSKVLDMLPLKNDLGEGADIMKHLFNAILNKHSVISHSGLSGKIVSVIQNVTKLRKEDEFLDDEGLALYIQVINALGIQF